MIRPDTLIEQPFVAPRRRRSRWALLPIIAAGADLLVAEGRGARDADASPATLCVRERRADRRKSGSQWTSPLEGDGFEPSVPVAREPVYIAEGELRGDRRAAKKIWWGTDVSNPSPSSGESPTNRAAAGNRGGCGPSREPEAAGSC